MQAEAGAGRDPPIGIWGSQTGLFLYLGEGSEILLPKNMIILGEQVKDLKSGSQAGPGKQLAFPKCLECSNYCRVGLQCERLQQEIFRRAQVSSDPDSWFLKCQCVPGVCLCMCLEISVSNWLAILIQWKESYHPQWQHACRKTCIYSWTLGERG